jgi:hypothetical protein
MNSHLAWNHALGEYFFHPKNEGKFVTLYLDRRRIEEIGQQNGLGGWDAFFAAAATKVPTTYLMPRSGASHPLLITDHLHRLWRMRKGVIHDTPVEQLPFPPILVGIALLVLAWTENDLPFERSYYGRLHHFLQRQFTGIKASDDQLHTSVARSLADALPSLKTWLSLRHGRQRGELLLGKRSSHRWVGTLQFHALLDHEERNLLPSIWIEIGLQAHRKIEALRLLDLVEQCPQLDQHLPLLRKALKNPQPAQRRLVASLLHAEFEAWDGATVSPSPASKLRKSPRLRIRFDDNQPSQICIEWPDAIDRLECRGKTYRVQKLHPLGMGMLTDSVTGELIVPDAEWLFGDLVLHNGQIQIKRPARQHFWLWPASSLGYPSSGFLESTRFLEDSAFRLIAQENAVAVVEDWIRTPHACQVPKSLQLLPGIKMVKGSYPKWNPFQPPKTIPPKPTLRISAKNRISDATYRAEFPLQVEVCGNAQGVQFMSEGLLQDQIPLQVDAAENGDYLLTHPSHGFNSSYNLYLRSESGEILDNEVIHFKWTEPLQLQIPAIRQGFNAKGEWEEISPTGEGRLFLHNRFCGAVPASPEILGQPLLACKPVGILDRPFPDLGGLLVAGARRDGSLSIDTFKQLAKAVATTQGQAEPSDAELHELRRIMSTLGFFHYDYITRQLQLSPLSFCFLPEDHPCIRALLLGPLPHSVMTFLQNWSHTENEGIEFRWRYLAAFAPPMLELHCTQIAHLRLLKDALELHFPNAISPLIPQSLSETLLVWLDRIPDFDPSQSGARPDWTSFPDHDERWDVKTCAFVKTEEEPAFPALTRNTQGYARSWECRWWEDERRGYDVSHQIGIPKLHQRLGLPFVAENVARTDEILIAGRFRQSDLLERALVMATGQLPQRITADKIPEWAGTFEPTASFRLFCGIRPQMRVQLHRIFQEVLNLSHPTFPQIHLH